MVKRDIRENPEEISPEIVIDFPGEIPVPILAQDLLAGIDPFHEHKVVIDLFPARVLNHGIARDLRAGDAASEKRGSQKTSMSYG